MSAGLGEPVDEAAAAIVEALESYWWASITEPVLEILGHGDWARRSAVLDALQTTRSRLSVAGMQGSAEADRARQAAAAEWAGRISRLQADGTVTAGQVRQLAESLRQRLRDVDEHEPGEPDGPDWATGVAEGFEERRSLGWPGDGLGASRDPGGHPIGSHPTDEGVGPPGTSFGDADDDDD
jgi:hypothetical protein